VQSLVGMHLTGAARRSKTASCLPVPVPSSHDLS
jgi:hypothetical protein